MQLSPDKAITGHGSFIANFSDNQYNKRRKTNLRIIKYFPRWIENIFAAARNVHKENTIQHGVFQNVSWIWHHTNQQYTTQNLDLRGRARSYCSAE